MEQQSVWKSKHNHLPICMGRNQITIAQLGRMRDCQHAEKSPIKKNVNFDVSGIWQWRLFTTRGRKEDSSCTDAKKLDALMCAEQSNCAKKERHARWREGYAVDSGGETQRISQIFGRYNHCNSLGCVGFRKKELWASQTDQ